MIILLHRGLWNKRSEQNTLEVFNLSSEDGFGIEIDLRDCRGGLLFFISAGRNRSLSG